ARSRAASRPTFPVRSASRAWTSRRSPRDGCGRRAARRSSPPSRWVRGAPTACSTPARLPAARRRCSAARPRRPRATRRAPAARAGELGESVRRLGAASVTVVRAAATALPEELDGFDRALVDAPCSGLGVLARRPDLRWRARPLPELELALLRSAAERVRPGGTIVYSVCTLNADENEAVVDASGLDVDATLADEWPKFRHPHRPNCLLPRPHVHAPT